MGLTTGGLSRDGGIRTHDLSVPNAARYQAALRPDCKAMVGVALRDAYSGSDQQLGDLDRVQGGSLAKVVADDPQIDPTRLTEGLPNPPDKHIVDAGTV